jgi:small redox-active disulfide protein 2
MKRLQILGPGCSRCKKLAENAEAAARVLGIEYELEKVTDMQEIVKFAVMSTPALVVDGQVKVAGQVPDVETLKEMLK